MGIFKKNTENYNDYAEENFNEDFGTVATEDTMDSFGDMTAAEPAAFAPAAPALKIVNPKDYKDGVEIANLLMNGNTILLNIEGIAKDPVVIRLLDYLSGAVHVSGGLMPKVSKTTIVIAPKNVDVSSIEAMVSAD